jgi:hypothetical protein
MKRKRSELELSLGIYILEVMDMSNDVPGAEYKDQMDECSECNSQLLTLNVSLQ